LLQRPRSSQPWSYVNFLGQLLKQARGEVNINGLLLKHLLVPTVDEFMMEGFGYSQEALDALVEGADVEKNLMTEFLTRRRASSSLMTALGGDPLASSPAPSFCSAPWPSADCPGNGSMRGARFSFGLPAGASSAALGLRESPTPPPISLMSPLSAANGLCATATAGSLESMLCWLD
jgi:hypothetical protein